MEPILEQYRPVILASMKFRKLTLGTVAPQFTGQCDDHKFFETECVNRFFLLQRKEWEKIVCFVTKAKFRCVSWRTKILNTLMCSDRII